MKSVAKRVLSPFQSFVRSESASGVVLIVVAVVAFLWANSPWADLYETMKNAYFGVSLGGDDGWVLEKPVILWVNDALMAIFFLFVGLEIKREIVVGELSDRKAAALPIAAAVGGMVLPALIYVAVNINAPDGQMSGWGIPMATDIAFALGIMALLGSRVPLALKVFLTALAIIDDLGAVLVIALFYTAELDVMKLGLSLAFWGLALLYAFFGGRKLPVFALLGVIMWYFMLKSGVHATVAGVLLALAVPMGRAMEPTELKQRLAGMFRGGSEDEDERFELETVQVEQVEGLVRKTHSPLHNLEHGLQPWVAFGIMPIFALFNAGFVLGPEASLGAPVSLGAFLGLLIGKVVGVTAFAWLAVATGVATLPDRVNWGAIVGTGFLAGIGFTMSLFIAALAFDSVAVLDQAKLGVLSASVIAAVVGLVLLARFTPASAAEKG